MTSQAVEGDLGMGSWALLPENVDLPRYEDWQDRENQRNPKSVMSHLWRWVK